MTQKYKTVEHRLASAWYILYPQDPYALGPMRFEEFVPATEAVNRAYEQFGEYPYQVWPDGPTVETDEYELELVEIT